MLFEVQQIAIPFFQLYLLVQMFFNYEYATFFLPDIENIE